MPPLMACLESLILRSLSFTDLAEENSVRMKLNVVECLRYGSFEAHSKFKTILNFLSSR